MPLARPLRVGYVLKMYPRFSETFVLREILAHEAAGLELAIFSLRPPADGRFHEALAHVRAPVTYLERPQKAEELWARLRTTGGELPGVWETLADACKADADDVYQALLVAEAASACSGRRARASARRPRPSRPPRRECAPPGRG